jgi:hypothetical protein
MCGETGTLNMYRNRRQKCHSLYYQNVTRVIASRRKNLREIYHKSASCEMCNIILIAQYVSGETILEDFIKREIIILEWILQNSEIKFLFTMKARKV